MGVATSLGIVVSLVLAGRCRHRTALSWFDDPHQYHNQPQGWSMREKIMKHGYLIDMDGVLYRGSELIPGAESFVQELRARQIPFRLLTNNSQRTRRDVVAKVARLGIDVEEEHIFTSAMATARFLAQQ